MTDSTIDEEPGEGTGIDVGSSGDELFGGIVEDTYRPAERGDDADSSSAIGDETPPAGTAADRNEEGVEDRTAASIFGELKDDVGDDTDSVLGDESPDEIIATADEPDPEPAVDDDLVADEAELEDLLLTGRTKDQEFLWVDPDGTDGTDADEVAESDPTEPDAAPTATPEADDATDAPPLPAPGADGSSRSLADEPASGNDVTDSTTTADDEPALLEEREDAVETADDDSESESADSPGLLRRLASFLKPF